jgi:hypothetical protein
MKTGYILTTKRLGGRRIGHPFLVYSSNKDAKSALKLIENKLPGYLYSYREIAIPYPDVEKD